MLVIRLRFFLKFYAIRTGMSAASLTVPHSVMTTHLIDEAGQPTVAARDEILAFLARRLHAKPQADQA